MSNDQTRRIVIEDLHLEVLMWIDVNHDDPDESEAFRIHQLVCVGDGSTADVAITLPSEDDFQAALVRMHSVTEQDLRSAISVLMHLFRETCDDE